MCGLGLDGYVLRMSNTVAFSRSDYVINVLLLPGDTVAQLGVTLVRT
jgi:hypothetical protein